MELYIKVSFWLGVVGVVLRMLLMCIASYPRTTNYSLAEDNVYLLITIGSCIWAGSLVY